MKTVFLFSGQGSHYYQMGRKTYAERGVFWRSMHELDEIARPFVGQSLITTLYDDRLKASDVFDDLMLTHPAIYMVELSLARALINQGVRPDLTLGASLGAFVAATVAGAITPENALSLVIEQARIFSTHCSPGGMLAVLAAPSLHDSEPLKSLSEIASVNFSSHFVLAAASDSLPRIRRHLEQLNISFQDLQVAYPFHSRWMESAHAPFEPALKGLELKPGALPMVCCMRSELLDSLDANYFWDVARQRVEFERTMARLEETGPFNYVDVGPSGTLATFLRYSLSRDTRSQVFPTLTPFGREQANLAMLHAELGARR